MVNPRGSEIFPNRLQRTTEKLSGSGGRIVRPVRNGPQIQERSHFACACRLHSRRASGTEWNERAIARAGIGNKRQTRLMQILAVAFIVREHEGLVFLNWPAQRTPELVSLKRRSRTLVEIVRCVESIVAKILKDRAVPLVCSGLSDNGNLAARVLAVFGAVGVPQ